MFSGSIDQPHPDIELGVARRPLRYIAAAPPTGIDRHTGILFYIAGYGREPCDAYAQHLITSLAARHNCISVAVKYYGAEFQAKGRVRPAPDFFENASRCYGIPIPAPADEREAGKLVQVLAQVLVQNGVKALDPSCLILVDADEYNSMGFLPALDHLQVLHHLLATHHVDKRRLFVIGTSYGGYVATLMAKLAPNTFRLVVDNCGFSSAEDDLGAVIGRARATLCDIVCETQARPAFAATPGAPNFFSLPRREIRSLFVPAHLFPNTARLYAYHGVGDRVAPTERKLRLREAFAGRIPYDLEIIDQSRIDGRLFKTPEHGLGASMRLLFERSYEKFTADGGALTDHTDFDLAHEIVFACSGEHYRLRYSPRAGIAAEIESVRRRSAAIA